MFRAKLPLFCLILALSLSLFPNASMARSKNRHCPSSFCGNLNITYPFRLKSQPHRCGYDEFEFECDQHNRTIFPMKYGNFSVQNISYTNEYIHLVDVNLLDDKNNCSIRLSSSRQYSFYNTPTGKRLPFFDIGEPYTIMYLVNCSMKMKNSSIYIDASRCTSANQYSSSSLPDLPPTNFFYFLDGGTTPRDFHRSCFVEAQVPIMAQNISGLSTFDIYEKLMIGFQLSWASSYNDGTSFLDLILWWFVFWPLNQLSAYIHNTRVLFEQRTSKEDHFYAYELPRSFVHGTYIYDYISKETQILYVAIPGILLLLRFLLGVSCLVALIIQKLKRRHLSADDTIENFLQSNNLVPIRYSYAEIKRITRGFNIELGHGGFGSVFKGKLRSGKYVAVKLLNKSKANGQDFINEVATVGRIHHVNVVQLIGFCVEGTKQALVYDFMTNGSLDKIIFSSESIRLSWEKMFEIVVGVARGIEYLHRGCEMQILHFDIKPHNILLDENFNPKISDFGLAKLYSVDDSVISLTAARGTLGYMAPELFYKNIGSISYKADVYSFGMMLMEIVGRRKNLNVFADHSSQIYFPSWIYDRFHKGDSIEIGDLTEKENKIVRKMVIVGFWCMQTNPTNRPSMNKVLEMLESKVELLEMPPKSFLFSVDMYGKDSNPSVCN